MAEASLLVLGRRGLGLTLGSEDTGAAHGVLHMYISRWIISIHMFPIYVYIQRLYIYIYI